jgi:hypothetical protein
LCRASRKSSSDLNDGYLFACASATDAPHESRKAPLDIVTWKFLLSIYMNNVQITLQLSLSEGRGQKSTLYAVVIAAITCELPRMSQLCCAASSASG